MMTLLKRLFYEEDGQSMVEYGLILALVAVAVVVVLGTMGGSIKKLFQDTTTELEKRPTP
ncbi:MAG: Flp family type IVb pilin [Firmicutes bacterium]|nr:Flp family type IVb pilin [Bacillota bacterium]